MRFVGKHLPDAFPFQNGLKQGDIAQSLLLSPISEQDISKIQENLVVLKLTGTHLAAMLSYWAKS
jgi:hypothetical protein